MNTADEFRDGERKAGGPYGCPTCTRGFSWDALKAHSCPNIDGSN